MFVNRFHLFFMHEQNCCFLYHWVKALFFYCFDLIGWVIGRDTVYANMLFSRTSRGKRGEGSNTLMQVYLESSH